MDLGGSAPRLSRSSLVLICTSWHYDNYILVLRVTWPICALYSEKEKLRFQFCPAWLWLDMICNVSRSPPHELPVQSKSKPWPLHWFFGAVSFFLQDPQLRQRLFKSRGNCPCKVGEVFRDPCELEMRSGLRRPKPPNPLNPLNP